MIRRTLLMFALTVVAVIGPMATARACSCMVPDAARFLAESDFVFAGSLVEPPGGAAGQVDEFGFENVAYRFEVDAVYKGDIRDSTVEVWSASNGAACGFEMAPGQPVAIAASFDDGRLSGGLCSTFGVEQLEAAATDAGIEPVVPDDPPVQSIADPEQDTPVPWLAVGIGFVLAVVGGGMGIVLARRTRRV